MVVRRIIERWGDGINGGGVAVRGDISESGVILMRGEGSEMQRIKDEGKGTGRGGRGMEGGFEAGAGVEEGGRGKRDCGKELET